MASTWGSLSKAMAAVEENRLLQLRSVWQKDLFENVVPFWLEHGLDEEHGGYFTCLDEDGSCYDDTKFMWLNGRALYTFSRLYCEFPGAADRNKWRRAAEIGAPFLDRALDEHGALFFSTTRAGERLHFQRKPYAAVFYAQGCLQYYRMLKVIEDEKGEPHHEDADAVYGKAAAMFERLLEWIEDPTKCGRPPRPHPEAASSLADVMCVASLSLDFLQISADAATRDRHRARVADVQRKVLAHYDRDRRIFMEAATADGVDGSTPAGRLFVPGHSIEVSWFLLQTCDEVPNEALAAVALDALEGSLERGWDDHHGGLVYMLDVEGRPLVDATVTDTDKLWWPHTEALIALTMALSRRNGDEDRWLGWLNKVQAYCYDHFATDKEWYGYLKEDGTPRSRAKGGNYKGFFHLPRALIMCVQMAGPQYYRW